MKLSFYSPRLSADYLCPLAEIRHKQTIVSMYGQIIDTFS